MLYLQLEMDKWAAESYDALRAKRSRSPNVSCKPGAPCDLEVDLLKNRDDYVHVAVPVCSENAGWSGFHPWRASFLVYHDGRVSRPAPRAETKV